MAVGLYFCESLERNTHSYDRWLIFLRKLRAKRAFLWPLAYLFAKAWSETRISMVAGVSFEESVGPLQAREPYLGSKPAPDGQGPHSGFPMHNHACSRRSSCSRTVQTSASPHLPSVFPAPARVGARLPQAETLLICAPIRWSGARGEAAFQPARRMARCPSLRRSGTDGASCGRSKTAPGG